MCATTQLGRCAKTFIVRKSVQVMIMSPSVTFFQKSIIIMRMRVKAYFQTQQFSIFNSFFSDNNHNQNRKSSLKLERDIKPKSEGISILRIIINRIKSVKYVSLVRFAQFWLFNQKITKLVCFAQLWFFLRKNNKNNWFVSLNFKFFTQKITRSLRSLVRF